MPRAAIVYNPVKVDLDRLRTAIEKAESEHGWNDTLWLETSKDDPGTGQAAEARDAAVDMVLAAGGDGTVRAVAESLRDSGVSLGLLPAGTGNLLARNLDLTIDDLEHSVQIAFSGKDRKIDLGIASLTRPGSSEPEERAFLVMAGLGLDAQMISNSDEELKSKIGVLAYVKSIFVSLSQHRNLHLMYQLDDQEPRKAHIHTVMVGNCGSLQGNLMLLPDAAVDDGKLDLLALRPEGPGGWAQVIWKVLVENALLRRFHLTKQLPGVGKNSEGLNYQQCRRFEARLSHTDEIELDGDEFGEVTRFTLEVDPGAITVRVPKD